MLLRDGELEPPIGWRSERIEGNACSSARSSFSGATHWSIRRLAAETGISKTSVHRLLQVFRLQPHRRDTFKLSTDPFFIEKLRDVVGLYLDPDKALVLCVDEKTTSRRWSAPSRCCRWASATRA